MRVLIKPHFRIRDDRHRLIAVADYLAHLNPNEKIRVYAERRWDLMNLFGSMFSAVLLGMIGGLGLRWALNLGADPSKMWWIFVVIGLVELVWLQSFVGIWYEQEMIGMRIIYDSVKK